MIKLFEQYNTYNQIKNWLVEMSIKYYTINDDLTVDVDGSVYLIDKELSEIPLQFRNVVGSFDCSSNKLISLKGCPIRVDGSFRCSHNFITTLEYSPGYVGEGFSCIGNKKLNSLEHCPKYVGGDFYAYKNSLTTLKYFPEYIGMKYYLDDNQLPDEIFEIYDIKELIKYQDEYGIWNNDGSFNKGRWDIFFKDYESGILT